MEEPRFVDWERGMLACARRCLVLPLLIALVVPPASAQDLRVRVIDEFSGSPVPGALVTVFDSVGWAVDRRQTGATGTFAVAPPVPGTYQIWTTGLGYEPLLSRAVRIDPATSEVEIRLRPKPLEMEPVRATVAAQRRVLRAVGFYHRLQIGVGRFITAEDPELRDAIKVTDALRMEPSVHIVPDRGGPAISGRRSCSAMPGAASTKSGPARASRRW